VPPEHIDPAAQARPQLPQFASEERDTQTPLQFVRPAAQQSPLEQFPLAHWLPL